MTVVPPSSFAVGGRYVHHLQHLFLVVRSFCRYSMLLHVDCTYYFMCDYCFGLSFYHIFHGFYVRVILRISYVFCLRGNCIYVGKVVRWFIFLSYLPRFLRTCNINYVLVMYFVYVAIVYT